MRGYLFLTHGRNVCYGTLTPKPIPEFPVTLELFIVIGCLAATLIIERGLTNIAHTSLPLEDEEFENG